MANITHGPAPGTGATVGYSSPVSRLKDALADVPEENLLTVNLDGRDVQAVKGETIMEVCHREDIYVPHYCWHPALSIAGNCRLCLVEVEKAPKPLIACQTHVTPGMVVRTASEVARKAQEWMMEFLLVNHPLDCPICDRGGECQLQRYSMEYGTGHTRMADKKRKFIKPQADPLIDIERNRCIMCTRCVRFCDEVGGEHVMGVFDRGEGNYIGTFGQGPVSNIFSGNVIDLCPVGCLTSKPFRFKARSWELKQTQTTCDGCSSGCKVTAWTRNNKLYRVTPPSRLRHDHFTINEDTEEFICNQGRFGSDYSQSDTRRDESMIRIAGRLAPTSFEDAVRRSASDLKAVVEAHGPDSVAVLVSPRATLEEGFLARRIAREIVGTPHLDWRSSWRSREIADAISAALGAADGDFSDDPDTIVVVNGKHVWQSPVLASRIQENGRRYGARIVMLGHHHDDYIAAFATDRFHNQPGNTAATLDALAKAVSSGDYSPLTQALNLTEDDARGLAETLKSARRTVIVHGLEDFGGAYAPKEVPAAVALRNALGDACGYLPVVRDRNAVGLHSLNIEPGEGGVSAPNLTRALADGRIKGLFVFGADTLASLADQEALASGLAGLDALVLADPFNSAYSSQASSFLALAGPLERSGTYVDIEGSVALLSAATERRGDSRPGIDLLTALGRALGAENFGGDHEAVWTAVRSEVAPESTAALAELEIEGSSNPAHFAHIRKEGGARNRGRAYNPGTYREDGLRFRARSRATVGALASGAIPEVPEGEGLLLTWGPHLSGKGYFADRASAAEVLLPKPFLEIHPRDAAAMKVKDDQFAVLTVGGKRSKVALRIGHGPAPGCVYLSAGVYGPFDPGGFEGPVRVELTPLDESAPNQGDVLVASEGGSQESGQTH